MYLPAPQRGAEGLDSEAGLARLEARLPTSLLCGQVQLLNLSASVPHL